ncbi:MAG: hypothetical protein KatS3mg081_2271 [Gemmatimonadales bacterium]|nr:hypothetical protein HRbin33_00974 [bacterium HR33]GIW52916.1 MAG: hypothetical protein KatS3mg081_2271 [Gemmatimonadales bacterium]
MQSTSKAKSVAAVVSFFAAACAGSNAATLEYGECADVFGGRVCTWGVTQGSEVTEFGVTVPMLSVEGAPAHGEIPWPPVEIASLRLPQSVTAQTGFDHLKLYWEHHGHPPGPYLYPHFDFHFYNMGPERVTAIDCEDTQKPHTPPVGYALPDVEIPAVGVLPGLCVPAMGMHALPRSELQSGRPFEATMVIGYYAGEPIFVEPMITREKLVERQSFPLAMPELAHGNGVTYPTQFVAEYDAEGDAYRLRFHSIGVK